MIRMNDKDGFPPRMAGPPPPVLAGLGVGVAVCATTFQNVQSQHLGKILGKKIYGPQSVRHGCPFVYKLIWLYFSRLVYRIAHANLLRSYLLF